MTKVLGIDISDINTTLVYYNDTKIYKYPSTICKDKNTDNWLVGEEAYESLLSGSGYIYDKLLSMTDKDQFVIIEDIKYYGIDLLQIYLSILIDKSLRDANSYPDKIVVSIPYIKSSLVEKIVKCLNNLGYLKANILVISRAEAFIYYTLSKDKEIWNNRVALFDLSNQNFVYYELKIKRLSRTSIVYAESKKMEESINIDLLNNKAGAKLVDKILTDTAKKLIDKKRFSSIILTGKGFEKLDWAKDFLALLCEKRRVYFEGDIFAVGASVKALELSNKKDLFNITCICDGRLDTSIGINVEKEHEAMEFNLFKAGDRWYDLDSELRIIPDSVDELEISLLPIEQKRKKIVKIKLDFLKDRPNKTKRIDVKTKFKDARTMVLDISDAGFGDFYPKTDAGFMQEVDLWE